MKKIYTTIIFCLCIFHIANGGPSFKLNSAITVTPSPNITQGSYFTVSAVLKNNGPTTGPFDFECDFTSTSGVTLSVIGKQCNNFSGYYIPVNGTISLTFNAASIDATPIFSPPGNYNINIIACNIINGSCPACGTKSTSCISNVAANGYSLPYPVCVLPSAPTPSSATNITAISFTANWSLSSGATGYFVDVSSNSSFSSLIYNNTNVGNTTSYNFTGLSCNTPYYYRVRAGCSCGTSGNSSTISVQTNVCCTAPYPPGANAATNITTNSFTANWYFSTGASGYYVDVSTNSSFSNLIYNNTNVGNTTSYNFSGLNCNTLYYYRVRA